ncbi:helix-turn-helix domain-containing protein [Anaerosporobacter faecicola]|uniref:helix-turn-helix domain-containing protein n=1 Tax=Anaerosporobacter faecicola TaxID=2718714 RepID=UPI001438D337|nr:helix-turn-helix domain-containing protein [Anaerosporobacter faecicola]
MAKYSFEQKKKFVMAYLYGEGGTNALVKKYGYSTHSQLQRWIVSYQNYGDDGLKRSRQKDKYSFNQKLHVVELYLSSEVSYQELALKEGIANPNLITGWVNRFRIAGPDALRPHKKGRKKTLDKPKIYIKSQEIEEKTVDTSAEHVKEFLRSHHLAASFCYFLSSNENGIILVYKMCE